MQTVHASPTLADVLAAAAVIRGVADATPMLPAPSLTRRFGREWWLKLESAQPMGAFKLRGALNAMAALPEDASGVICCSTGNHGRAVAWAARARGLRSVVCLSSLVPEAKVAAIRALGAEVRKVGASQDDAARESARLAAAEGLVEIPPFDDSRVIAGQGTTGLEMLAARPDLAAILVPLSGGGLAAGVALAAKAIRPDLRVIGISMERGAAMHASLRAGRPVAVAEVASLADSLGGGIGADNRLTLRMCRDLLDDVVLVSEKEIYRALQWLYWEERLIAEGACVVGIAAAFAGRLDLPDGPVATIMTGRNVDMAQFTRVATGQDVVLDGLTVQGAPHGGA